METMVERVARAIGETCRPPDGQLVTPGTLLAARAAIEAMREPTEAMRYSCGDGECAKWAPGAWLNYIDAALSERSQKGVGDE